MKVIDKIFPTRKCTLCGKEFIPAPEHRYRERDKGTMFCSWHCFYHRNDSKVGKHTKHIEQCTPDGVVIKTYPSASKAAEENNTDAHYLRAICRRGTIHQGYLWRYKNDLPSV